MLIRVQQDLNCLPSHEATRQQCGERRALKGVVGRLKTVKAAQRLVNKGEGTWLCLQEQSIVIAADFVVEGSQSLRREIGCSAVVEGDL